MVGKLDIGQGDDYAFDIRAARAAAEAVVILPPVIIDGGQAGPFTSSFGDPYYLRVHNSKWQVGWDVDDSFGPDVWRRLTRFVANSDVEQAYRDDVELTANAYGWDGVS